MPSLSTENIRTFCPYFATEPDRAAPRATAQVSQFI
jgi:hypothetical protein